MQHRSTFRRVTWALPHMDVSVNAVNLNVLACLMLTLYLREISIDWAFSGVGDLVLYIEPIVAALYTIAINTLSKIASGRTPNVSNENGMRVYDSATYKRQCTGKLIHDIFESKLSNPFLPLGSQTFIGLFWRLALLGASPLQMHSSVSEL